MDKFKTKNPHYFKQYYEKNKHKMKDNSRKNYDKKRFYYTVKIAGTTYCFNHKKDIIIQKHTQKQLDECGNYIRIL